MQSRYYKDIDLLSLRGREELLTDELRYPYLRLDSLNKDEKRIVYFFGKDKSVSYRYSRKEDQWIWSEKSVEPDTTYFYFRLIDKNRTITDLKYGAADPFESDSAYLVTVSQFDGIRRHTYVFGRSNIKTPPSSDLNSFPLNKYFYKIVEDFRLENGVIMVSEEREFSRNKEILKEDRCFEIGKLSVSWYLDCYGFLPATSCN